MRNDGGAVGEVRVTARVVAMPMRVQQELGQAATELHDGRLDLVDYDGAFALPKAVITAMREANISIEEIFE